MDVKTYVCKDTQMDGWTNKRWIDKWIDRLAVEQMN